MNTLFQQSQRLVHAIGNDIIAREQEQQKIDALRKAMDFNTAESERLNAEASNLDDTNYNNFSEEFIKAFDENAAAVLDEAISDYHREQLESRLTAVRSNIMNAAVNVEAKHRVKVTLNTLNQIQTASSSSVFQNPDSFKQGIDGFSDVVDSQKNSLPYELREQAKRETAALLAESSIRGYIDTDPQKAVERIDKGDYNDYLDGVKLAQLKKMAESVVKVDNSKLRYELSEQMKDSLASYLASGVGIPVDEAQIKEVFGEDAVLKYRDDVQDAKAIFNNTANMETQSIADIQKVVNAIAPSPGEEGYSRKAKIANTVAQTADSIVKARLADPATAAMKVPSVAKIMRRIEDLTNSGDEASAKQLFPKMVEESLRAQRALGVPNHLTNPRPVSWAKQMVANLEAMTPDQAEGALLELQDTYGDQYDAVFGQLVNEGLSPEYSVLAWTAHTPVSSVVKQAIRLKGEEAKSLFPDQAAFENMKVQVRSAMEPFINAVMLGATDGTRIQELTGYMNVIQKVAGIYANTGMTEIDAAERAYNEIIGNRLSFAGSLYVPKEYGDAKTVALLLEEKQRDLKTLKDFNPIPFGSNTPGLSEGTRKEALYDTIKSYGKWVTNEDGTGAYLAVDLDGFLTPILNGEGWRYEFKFQDLYTPDPTSHSISTLK